MTRKIVAQLATCVLMVLCCGQLLAAGYMEVTTEQVKILLEKKKDVLLVYPLSKIEYNDQHIAGSVNIPLEQLEKKLPANRDQPLVFYCLGDKCTASLRAAETAIRLGYKQVFAYREGLPAWVAAGYPTSSSESLPKISVEKISTDELHAGLQDDDSLVLLDCSLKADAEKFRIDSPKRIYIPLEELQDQYAKLPRDKKLAVICLKGTRSPIAVRYLFKKGFKNMASVNGGMEKWLLEKKPVIRNEQQVAQR